MREKGHMNKSLSFEVIGLVAPHEIHRFIRGLVIFLNLYRQKINRSNGLIDMSKIKLLDGGLLMKILNEIIC